MIITEPKIFDRLMSKSEFRAKCARDRRTRRAQNKSLDNRPK